MDSESDEFNKILASIYL